MNLLVKCQTHSHMHIFPSIAEFWEFHPYSVSYEHEKECCKIIKWI